MAKAGGRKYNRDKNGKFASTAGAKLGGKRKTSENLGQRGLGTSAPRGTIPRFAESRMMAGKNQRFAGKASKAPAPAGQAAPKAAAKPAAKTKPAAGSRNRGASQMAAMDVQNRRMNGRKLQGKGTTPMARATRNLERGMTTPGKKSVRSEKVARAAIDYYAATKTGGKKKRGKK